MASQKPTRIRPKERDAIIQSLRAGVTPHTGLQHIQVGRAKEVDALLRDIERIADGGSAFRLIVGEYGSGKTFFMQLIRAIAHEKRVVTLHADLSPDRRLYATKGQARRLYAELLHNCSTRANPDGNAIASIVERFITEARRIADGEAVSIDSVIADRLSHLSESVGGYDFAMVISRYWTGHETGNEQLKSDAIRWLRGEFTSKLDARNALGVRSIVDDTNIYEQLKLLSSFVRQAGYAGLLVNLDEMVNLYKLSNQKARISNYEKILSILNDSLQGSAKHIGFLMGGTPDFLIDPHRGLFSYEALRSRLAENQFARAIGVIDYSAPTMHLTNLAPEELLILLRNIQHVFAFGDSSKYLLPDDALRAFLAHCSKQIGDAYFRTPRNTIKAFVDMLTVIEQCPDVQWSQLVGKVHVGTESNSDMPEIASLRDDEDDDALATFRL
jgi:hypothetical protein